MPKEEPQAYPEELAVGEVREVIESALIKFGDVNRNGLAERVKQWRGKFSVYPEKVHPDVTSRSMKNKCWDFSEELADILWEEGFPVDLAISKKKVAHTYLPTSYKGHKIVIDPTIAQYVQRHNHVFVGTLNQLRRLVQTESWQAFEYVWDSPERKPINEYLPWIEKERSS
ncbi:MAG: hypothetical protein AAB531_04430 [Patescibacteria group bacterium]